MCAVEGVGLWDDKDVMARGIKILLNPEELPQPSLQAISIHCPAHLFADSHANSGIG